MDHGRGRLDSEAQLLTALCGALSRELARGLTYTTDLSELDCRTDGAGVGHRIEKPETLCCQLPDVRRQGLQLNPQVGQELSCFRRWRVCQGRVENTRAIKSPQGLTCQKDQ